MLKMYRIKVYAINVNMILRKYSKMLLKKLLWTFHVNVIIKINYYLILSRPFDIINLAIKYRIENEFFKGNR